MSNLWDMLGEHSMDVSGLLNVAGNRMSAMSLSSQDSNRGPGTTSTGVRPDNDDAHNHDELPDENQLRGSQNPATDTDSPEIDSSTPKAWYKDLSTAKLKDLLDSPASNNSNANANANPKNLSAGWKDIMSGSSPSEWYGNMTDKIVERIMYSALPSVSDNNERPTGTGGHRVQYQKLRPQLSIPLTSRNFSRMTSRMGFIYEIYYALVKFVSWENYALTLSILILYSYLCLHPRTLTMVPFLLLAYCVLTPAYVTRHPPEPHTLEHYNAPSQGLPLCKPPVPKPVPELSREFFMNVVDTQNMMAQFSDVYDFVMSKLELFAYFSDESRSSMTFVCCLIAASLMYILAPLLMFLPWKEIFAVVGWIVLGTFYFVCADYRTRLQNAILSNKEKEKEKEGKDSEPKSLDLTRKPKQSSEKSFSKSKTTVTTKKDSKKDPIVFSKLFQKFNNISHQEFPFDEPLEVRQVEIFEFQTYEIESHRWSSSIYTNDPQILRRFLNNEIQLKFPVVGVTSLNELLAPKGWNFTPDSSWTLDYWADAWVETRKLSHLVTIDSGEKWVYDVQDGQKVLNWRRRRWHRSCIRQQLLQQADIQQVQPSVAEGANKPKPKASSTT